MKIMQINAVSYGSTGKIMFSLADMLEETEKNQVLCTSGFTWKKTNRSDWFQTSNIFEKSVHTYMSKITGKIGCYSVISTIRLIKKMKRFHPDIVHLHNLHGWYINIPMLFHYIKKEKIQVVWTFHDCWPFTGKCAHFLMNKCEKWKTGCGECCCLKDYPQMYRDKSEMMYEKKKRWFTGIENMVIVTPSVWLKNLVQQSMLKEYKVKVIPNGINTEIFKPRKSDFRMRNGLKEKYIVLTCAMDWGEKKGLDVIIELSQSLDDKFKIVMVGVNDQLKKILPANIITISKTHNQEELAEIYSAADVFVNPTREDNYPTVNMEAIACGTPVVTFKVGGSYEMLDETCGIAVECNDIESMKNGIIFMCEQENVKESCLKKAREYDEKIRFREYIDLYEELI